MMWYEKNTIIFLVNFLCVLFMGLTFYFFKKDVVEFPIVLFLSIVMNLYNIYIFYNKAIDNTVNILGKFYKEETKKNIDKAVKKLTEL